MFAIKKVQSQLKTLAVTVKPPVSDHPMCENVEVAYWRWPLTRIESLQLLLIITIIIIIIIIVIIIVFVIIFILFFSLWGGHLPKTDTLSYSLLIFSYFLWFTMRQRPPYSEHLELVPVVFQLFSLTLYMTDSLYGRCWSRHCRTQS